ncbi:MAG: peptide-methionine (S)-S-oxide reductase MsrA [Acidobacteriota bacterium]
MYRLSLRILAILPVVMTLACNVAIATVTIPDPEIDAPLSSAKGEQTAVLAGGCFWGIEAVFEHVKGVIDVKSGYCGGSASTAHYEMVSAGGTAHAETVEVKYDPSQISFGQLLKVFFSVAHNPTELNRQGPDTGPQYRSAIFYSNEDQKQIARLYIAQLNAAKVFPSRIVTELAANKAFYEAEGYHQNYAALHPDEPYIRINDLPKVASLRKQFPNLYISK